ncbi:MAG TPA: hypothetical protein VKR58_00350 [Aquella sp.]|nr:hypothetical protein [Aquella sp.]
MEIQYTPEGIQKLRHIAASYKPFVDKQFGSEIVLCRPLCCGYKGTWINADSSPECPECRRLHDEHYGLDKVYSFNRLVYL